MLTLRGEHFYFPANIRDILLPHAPTGEPESDRKTLLARPAAKFAQRPAADRNGVGDQPSAGSGHGGVTAFPGSHPFGGPVDLETHSGCRGEPHYAWNGHSGAHL